MTAPVRLQLRRTKGFNLQRLSRETNGLEAVVVTRASKWGNPFLVHPNQKPGRKWGIDYYSVPTVEDSVDCFREMMTAKGGRTDGMRNDLCELRSKNLACNCPPGQPCHADVLLELANK